MKMLLITLLILIANQTYALADDTPVLTIKDYCSEIITAKSEFSKVSKWSIVRDVIRLKYFPGKLVSLDQISIQIPEQQRVHTPEQTQNTSMGRNVIFSITPPADMLAANDIEKMRARNDALMIELKNQTIQLMQIAQAASVDECITQVQTTGFDFDGYIKLVKERSSLQLVGQMDESAIADNIIARTLPNLYLDWEVIHSTDLMAVHEALQNPGIQNVVILSHGIANGKFVDSRISEYPLGFFSSISPSIRSITFFACHGEEIAKLYGIEAQLKAGKSEFAQRFLFISDGTKIAGMEESVPVKGFRSFMRKVDSALSYANYIDADQNTLGDLEKPVVMCTMNFDALVVTQGTLGIALNGNFIGSANIGSKNAAFKYPCELANRKVDIVTIKNLSLNENAGIQSVNFTITPSEKGKTLGYQRLTHYFRKDQSYQGSKYEFSFE